VQNSQGNQLDFDDDSGGGLNSKLVFSSGKAGTYKIFTGSLNSSPGPFILKITEAEEKIHTGTDLKIGGSLNNEAKKMVYLVKMAKGKSYRIDLKSKDFDSFLFLQDEDGKQLAFDDDSGGELDSRITHKADTAGVYRIVATSLGMNGRGN